MDRQQAKLSSALEIIGRAFSSPGYLQEALQAPFDPNDPAALKLRFTSPEGNKRLAHVGDKVLALCIVEGCYRDKGSTADMNDKLQRIYEKTRLIARCEETGLAACIALNNSQRNQAPPAQTKLDCIKAVVGAAYLDGGFDAAKMVMDKLGIKAETVAKQETS